eukprot:TRINITY_DN9763_c0_g1_i1.p1 TRINITY_DN9763_c0_g1~~TRINITY_DN9763_c0_g1_i1.p1  ORF type:complete len:256 (-),score=28.47 TRINITY_DN9763_c0_g1_i1:100-867(-)
MMDFVQVRPDVRRRLALRRHCPSADIVPQPTFARPWAYEESDANMQSGGTYMGDTTSFADPSWTGAIATCSTWGTSGSHFRTPRYHTSSACKPREETRAGRSLYGKWYGSSVEGSGRTASGVLHAPPGSCSRGPAEERVRVRPLTGPLHRQLEHLSRSRCHKLQTILHAVTERLLSLPDRRALASWLGQRLDASARQWLKEHNLGLATVLKHHADHFFLIKSPNNLTVVYLQKTAENDTFMYADQMFSNVTSVSL